MSRSSIRAAEAKSTRHGYRSGAAHVFDLARDDSHQHNGRADHVGGALLTSGASGHNQFLVVKPNQPKDDGD